MHPHFFGILDFYDTAISSDTHWFLLGRNVRGVNDVMRVPLEMRKLFDIYTCSFSDEQIFALGKARLEKKSEMEGNYSLHLSRNARSNFQSLLIDVVNFLGMLLDNVLS